MSDWRFPDSRMPTEEKRQKLCKMLFYALLEIRELGNSGEAEQAADVADAFHNLPAYLWSDTFSFSFFRNFLQGYQEKYGEKVRFNYLTMLDAITKEQKEDNDS